MFIDLGHTGIDVSVADEGVTGRIPRHIGHLPEHSVHRRQRRLGMLERLGSFVGRFLFAAEYHNDLAGRIKLDDHVRAFVGGPNVVFFVYPDRVRK